MNNAQQILNECHRIFRDTESARTLTLYRSRDNRLTFDERLFIIKEIEKVFYPVFLELRNVSPLLTDWDLLLCALSYEGFTVPVIAECFSVSNDAVRMRKSRLREKLPDLWFALIFHAMTKADENECHNSVTDNISDEDGTALSLTSETENKPADMNNNTPVRMTFAKAILKGLAGTLRFKGRASRPEFWYYTLFCAILIIVLTAAILILNNTVSMQYDHIVTGIWLTISLMVTFSHSAAAVRRFHDTECSGWQWCVTFLMPWLTIIILTVWYIEYDVYIRNRAGEYDHDPFVMSWADAIFFIDLIILIAANIWTVVRFSKKGTEGPNIYGPDPLYRENFKKTQ